MTHEHHQPGRHRSGGRIVRRDAVDPGPVTSVTTLFAPAPAATGPVPSVPPAPRTETRPWQTVLIAAALVVALAASVGVAVLWAANRKLTAEVEAAVAQVEAAQADTAAVRTALEAVPDAATVDALAARVDGVESWTGLPEGGITDQDDLQTRLLEVSTGIESLQDNLQDGLGTVRNDIASVRTDLAADDGDADRAEVDAVRSDLDALRSAVDDVRRDVGVLCWALGYRKDVAASC
ncbi:hypothetical protein [Isoptericola chiayiensis]|uniref:hypothetical protein n=1 Tax=Isoptericola chiayiensis TaxID=579446 RepID=UPI001551C271|nr:hypothetical protein [Isoptericola chiayiensis]NOW01932.1 putative membrane protein [Isoptericola chiayiensis]